jgi:hypothetical protein
MKNKKKQKIPQSDHLQNLIEKFFWVHKPGLVPPLFIAVSMPGG